MNKLIIPLVALMTASAGSAFAQTTPAPESVTPGAVSSRGELRRELRAEEMNALCAKLGLDPTAAAMLKATMARFGAQARPLRQDARQTRRALKVELAAPVPNQARLAQLTTQLGSDRAQLRTIGEARMDALKGQLTPQQFAQLLVSRRQLGRQFHKEMRQQMRGQ